MRLRTLALLLLQVSLIACSRPPAVSEETADAVGETQQVVAENAVSAVVSVREVVESVAPPETTVESSCVVSPEGLALIIRFEVSSEAYYQLKLQGVIWPKGRSGATFGIGYDGGYQTREEIAADWMRHPQVDRLVLTSGVVGERARDLVRTLTDVRTSYPLASSVFELAMLPKYCELARRTFRDGWNELPQHAKDTLVSTVFNRGASVAGSRRVEMYVLMTDCVPRADTACMAAQYRAMGARLGGDSSVGSGLRKRYDETAAFVELGEL